MTFLTQHFLSSNNHFQSFGSFRRCRISSQPVDREHDEPLPDKLEPELKDGDGTGPIFPRLELLRASSVKLGLKNVNGPTKIFSKAQARTK